MVSTTERDYSLSQRDASLRQDFESLLERSFQSALKPGAIAVGEILRVEKDGLLIDIGGKSEGFVSIKEIHGCRTADDLRATFAPGQIHEFYIVGEHDNDATYYQLSLRRVAAFKNWDQLKELKEANATVDVIVAGSTKGGILVNVFDLKGFIPASQIRVAKTLNELVGESLPAKILEVDKAKNKLILSNRAAVFEAKAAMRAETLSRLHEGDLVSGEIVKVTDFGVFVDINGIDGLLPLSEISWRRINHPSEALELGQRLDVMVLTVDLVLQRISLTRKRLEADPWRTVDDHFHVNQELEGRITKTLGSGVLVELMPGIEAYCAFSGAGSKFFRLQETCGFRIISINAPDRRLTLEYRYDAAPPPEEASEDAAQNRDRELVAV
ncbi:MAG: 30S ribosomal protein S1 [Vampirovibrionales bacterium]|nr:30S ribosomal protein S1 [Vampirovibrionales bacterium]